MKTLLLSKESGLKWVILEGDYSRFHNMLNPIVPYSKKDKELHELIYDSDGKDIEWSRDITLIENKEWDRVAIIH